MKIAAKLDNIIPQPIARNPAIKGNHEIYLFILVNPYISLQNYSFFF